MAGRAGTRQRRLPRGVVGKPPTSSGVSFPSVGEEWHICLGLSPGVDCRPCVSLGGWGPAQAQPTQRGVRQRPTAARWPPRVPALTRAPSQATAPRPPETPGLPLRPPTCSLLFPGHCGWSTDTVLRGPRSGLGVFPYPIRQTPGSPTPSTRCRAAAGDPPGGWRLCPPNGALAPRDGSPGVTPFTPHASTSGRRPSQTGTPRLRGVRRLAPGHTVSRRCRQGPTAPGRLGGVVWRGPSPPPQEAVTPGAPGCIVGREWPCSWGERHVV